MCAPSNQEWCVENASYSLLERYTWTHVHTHSMANVKMYSVCMTDPNITVCVLNVQRFSSPYSSA